MFGYRAVSSISRFSHRERLCPQIPNPKMSPNYMEDGWLLEILAIFSLVGQARLLECKCRDGVRNRGYGLAHLVSTPKSFELGGHMGYQNSCLDESFLFHPKKIFFGHGCGLELPPQFWRRFSKCSDFDETNVIRSEIEK